MINSATGKSVPSLSNSQPFIGGSCASYFPVQLAKNKFLLKEYGQSSEGGSVQQAFIHHAERRTMDKC